MILAGLILLVIGGEALVRGAGSLALRWGLSPLVVGLTVVAVATSAPELAVSVDAVFKGEADLAVGNVVGSNIANICLILGVGALVAPLVVKRNMILRDLPVMVGFSVLLLVLAPGGITLLEGVLLVVAFIAATGYAVRLGKAETVPVESDVPEQLSAGKSFLYVGIGVAALVGGAQLLVTGAVGIATALGVSELVIGLTVVSVGTSLPELAATVVAVRRGQSEMAVGNVVGSNIANIGLVLGVPALLSGSPIPVAHSVMVFDIPIVIALGMTLLVICYTDRRINRVEGGMLLTLYAAYLGYVLFTNAWRDGLEAFTLVMVWFVLPLIALMLGVAATRQFRTDSARLVRERNRRRATRR